ncbi:snRNA-activating protein of 50kDa MW C terminal-domain-containing protein [Glomus cerebriforme]|uniref:snRNA-activating protein of 50kDa MW C terminal-domain-containing protein n=1 Tax=Glomus cerebriforme TaxID=658196 RepID=A0A397SPQ4_9GLOM|nr:snRNA-activating protein of 50kDa MW C terminal-domain-containing protein [Glomus cerebriforme]
MKNINNNVSVEIPNVTNASVEKQSFDTRALQNDLISINDINIITKPDNVEEAATLLEAYFETINNQSTTIQKNTSQISISTGVNTHIEEPALNGRNSENELAAGDEPTDSNSIPEWSLNVGEPTELIVVKQFADSFATAFEHEISEIQNIPLSSKKLSKSQYREIAENVQECLKLSSQFFADPTLFSLLRQYYSIDGSKAQNGLNSGSITLPPLSSSSTGETEGNTSQNKNKGRSSTRKRKAFFDECNVQGKDGQESSRNNKRIKRQNGKDGTHDSSNGVASSSRSGNSNTIVPAVSISAITAAASGSKGTKSRKDIDSSERPEPSVMEKRFWEMAALLDSSPLASLNSKYRASAPAKKRNDLNYVSSISSKKSGTIREIANNGTPEVVLSVAFYNQSNPPSRTQSNSPSRTQEFLVLGSQPLVALRDAFYCVSDFYKQEVSELPASVNALNSPEEKKSGSYFFIEDVFYNDCRDKDALDYSKIIVEWVNQNERYTHPGLGLYQRKNMDEVTFSDLSIRLNQPYLFVHKGDCEHAIVFTDLRLWHKADGLDANAFPKATFKCRIIRHKCRMCITRPAALVTINDFMAGETPAYFCDKCYNEYHYDSNSNLLYDNYKVFRYAHD